MFVFNLKMLLLSKGIDEPYAYLVGIGFKSTTASDYLNNKRKSITLPHMDRLCVNLFCTPNDLVFWKPTQDSDDVPTHPLQKLKDPKIPAIKDELKFLNRDDVTEVKNKIEELKKKKK